MRRNEASEAQRLILLPFDRLMQPNTQVDRRTDSDSGQSPPGELNVKNGLAS